MEYRIELSASFKKEAKRLGKHYASFADDYDKLIDETEINLLYIYDKAECSTITPSEIEELLRKNGLHK